jgi:hypothetical protein
MDFGHGFVPRIDKRNWSGIDRALGPAGRLPLDDPLELPWVILDLAWALGKPSIVDALHAHGVRVIGDASAWRYREQATFTIETMATAPYAPTAPIRSDGTAIRSFVEHVLRAQAEIGVDAYLLPGFVPRSRTDDTRAMTLEAIDVAVAMTDLEPRPWIAYIGVHSEQLEAGVGLLGEVSRSVAAVYAQITPFKPQADTASKLLRCADLYEHAAADFTVIAGRAAGAGNFFRALGAHAADAGLAEGETFEFASKMRPRKPSDSLKGKGTGRRVYIEQLGLSVPGRLHQVLATTAGLQHYLRCNLPCCRFNPLDSTRTRAVEHTVRTRVAEAAKHHGTPATMRPERLMSEYASRSSTLKTCNSILQSIGEKPLPTKHVDHQSAAVARRMARIPAA